MLKNKNLRPTTKSISRNIVLKYKVWLETKEGKGILGGWKIDFLKSIDEGGSIQAAVKKTGISYRKAWDNLKEDEQKLGFPIVQKQRGGQEGGKTTLTKEGRQLIKIYEELHKEFDKAFNKIINKIID